MHLDLSGFPSTGTESALIQEILYRKWLLGPSLLDRENKMWTMLSLHMKCNILLGIEESSKPVSESIINSDADFIYSTLNVSFWLMFHYYKEGTLSIFWSSVETSLAMFISQEQIK